MTASPFLTTREAICPPDLLARAQEIKSPRVAIAAAGSALPMEAAFEATEAGIMEPVFVGDPAGVKTEAEKLKWDISSYPRPSLKMRGFGRVPGLCTSSI